MSTNKLMCATCGRQWRADDNVARSNFWPEINGVGSVNAPADFADADVQIERCPFDPIPQVDRAMTFGDARDAKREE